MKNTKYSNVGTILKFNRTIIERGEIYILNTQIHDRSFSCLGTGTSIKSGGVKLVIWAQTSPLWEMMRSYTCFICDKNRQSNIFRKQNGCRWLIICSYHERRHMQTLLQYFLTINIIWKFKSVWIICINQKQTKFLTYLCHCIFIIQLYVCCFR